MSNIEHFLELPDDKRAGEYFKHPENQEALRELYARATQDSLAKARREFDGEVTVHEEAIYPGDPEYETLTQPGTEA